MDEERLTTEANVWLATVRPDGTPHLVPIWFVWVEGLFWICTGRTSVKVRNLQANAACSVALEDGNRPVVARCTARILAAPHPRHMAAEFKRKYDWDVDSDEGYEVMLRLEPVRWVYPGGT